MGGWGAFGPCLPLLQPRLVVAAALRWPQRLLVAPVPWLLLPPLAPADLGWTGSPLLLALPPPPVAQQPLRVSRFPVHTLVTGDRPSFH